MPCCFNCCINKWLACCWAINNSYCFFLSAACCSCCNATSFSISYSCHALWRSSSVKSSSGRFSNNESCSWYVTIKCLYFINNSARSLSFGKIGVGLSWLVSGSNVYNSCKSDALKWRCICCSSITRHESDCFFICLL